MTDTKTTRHAAHAVRTGFASEAKPLGECPPGWRDDPHLRTIDARIAEMRAFLERMRPQSDAEALKCLRDAFPETSLSSRVAVIARAERR